MGDNIRLKGPLGLKQDIYDDKRAKEFKKLFQLTPKEFIAEYDKKLLEEKKQEKNGGYMKVKKLLPGGLLTPGMRLLVKAIMRKGIKKTPEVAAETFEDIKKSRDLIQKSDVTFRGKRVDTSRLSDKDEVFKKISPLAAKIKKTELYEKLSNLSLKSSRVKESAKEAISENLENLKQYKDQTAQKIRSIIHKDVFKPTMQKSGGFVDMTKDKKYWKGVL